MRRFSGPKTFFRILLSVSGIILAVGYYSHVRAQQGLAGQGMVIPLRPLAPLSSVPVPEVFGMDGILANKAAAIQLGKALFWDMQAGSDDAQACASCHFNAGADSRPNNDVNPGQAGGDNTFQLGVPINGAKGTNYHFRAGSASAGFGGYHDGDWPFRKLSNVNDRFSVTEDQNDVSGSQGVFLSQFGSVTVPQPAGPPNPVTGEIGEVVGNHDGDGGSDDSGPIRGTGGDRIGDRTGGNSGSRGLPRPLPVTQGGQSTVSQDSVETNNPVADPVFSYPDPVHPGKVINTRRTTGRNTPSVVNAVFNFRNFWDGRAQNVCNGTNPFGARDKAGHLLIVGTDGKLGQAVVNMKNSALCSQALGPILNGTEMSADGRSFPDVGRKLLARVPLAKQMVDPTDSVLGAISNSPKPGISSSYMALIQQAFVPEWWQFRDNICVGADGTALGSAAACPAGTRQYSQMEYNFSIFWGVAIQMYESTLVADQTPFDKFMAQQQSYDLIGDNHTQSYTIQLQPGIQPYSVSVVALDPLMDSTDQDTYAFDYGDGRVMGPGLDSGNVDYTAGTLTVLFGLPPSSRFPIRISYTVGTPALTDGQRRGLLLFQTKGRCIACHGGPELSNASVGTVSNVGPAERMVMADMKVRVYDTGYYHIGVRPTAEDGGLAGTDPVAGLPLSQSEYMRQRICNGSGEVLMIPGRPGDGIVMAPLDCSDDTARGGFFKAPQLRNIALTAPYFHNGSQLTLEQVVEFYNRGADFNTFGEEHQYMDADIDILGLTLQDQTDLVDFLRNGLTDQRTVLQAAPFDHPQLFTNNGHPFDANGYPVRNDPAHPGQATNQQIEVPAVGQNGGKPLPTFLENLLGVK